MKQYLVRVNACTNLLLMVEAESVKEVEKKIESNDIKDLIGNDSISLRDMKFEINDIEEYDNDDSSY